MRHEILRMENIITYAGGIRLVDHAKLNLFRGEIIGIVGLNYSGKTALLGGINGLLPYSRGITYFQENQVVITSVREANQKGIFYIDPKFNLIPGCTIAENMYLKDNESKSLFYHARECRQRAAAVLREMKLDISPQELVENLSYWDKILIAICKAVANQASIIIFDCILSAVAKSRGRRFGQLFQMLQDKNISIILVEPVLKTLRPYCDRLFVMRQGSTVGEFEAAEINEDKVIALMLGHPIEAGAVSVQPSPTSSGQDEILAFSGVSYNDVLKDLNLHIYRYEITGVLNLNRYSSAAIEALLSGNARPDCGRIYLNGRPVRLKDTRAAVVQGIGVVGEIECLCDEMTLEENILISAVTKYRRRFGFLKKHDFKYIRDQVVAEYITGNNHSIAGEELPQGWLMRKKVAFCRALAAEPELMVLVNPTQYIDQVSRREFYRDIISLKKKKISVLLVSADIEEIIAVCDRMIVVQGGRATESLQIDEKNIADIIKRYGQYIKSEGASDFN